MYCLFVPNFSHVGIQLQDLSLYVLEKKNRDEAKIVAHLERYQISNLKKTALKWVLIIDLDINSVRDNKGETES